MPRSDYRLKLGTPASRPLPDPIVLAKQVATLDYISEGRFRFGVAPGWLEEEMRNHNVDPAARWRILRERVLAMKAIWTQEEAEFHCQFVDFDPIYLWPSLSSNRPRRCWWRVGRRALSSASSNTAMGGCRW